MVLVCKQKIYANVCKSKNFEDFFDQPSRPGILNLPETGRGLSKMDLIVINH